MKKKNDEDPPLWLTVLKLLLGLAVIVGGVGFALNLALKQEQADSPAPTPNVGWGISNDSPIFRKR